jgi:hypothetical protein
MKIWRNNKRVVKTSKYIYCQDCALVGEDFYHCSECLASRYKIHNSKQVCLRGYKYETDV